MSGVTTLDAPIASIGVKVRTAKPDIGVIRWDGHMGDGTQGWFTQSREIWALFAEGANQRLPYCGYYVGNPEQYSLFPPFKIHCDTIAVAMQEIEMAAYAGINFFAFAEAPKGSGVEVGLERYDQASNNHLVQHSLILSQSSYDEARQSQNDMNNSNAYIDKLVLRMQRKNYKYVMVNGVSRPLLFVYNNICDFEGIKPTECPQKQAPSGCRNCSPWLFEQINNRLNPDPYYVFLGDGAQGNDLDKFYMHYLKMDAISRYAAPVPPDANNQPQKLPYYPNYATYVRMKVNGDLWDVANATAKDMVPFASSGGIQHHGFFVDPIAIPSPTDPSISRTRMATG